MKYFDSNDLHLLPYNYYFIKDTEIMQQSEQEGNNHFFVEVENYSTTQHFLNPYNYKTIAKYFNEHEFEKY